MFALFFALLLGHALTDYPLQGDSMARGKNFRLPPQNVPPGQKINCMWPYWMTAHALIHAGAVWIITGSIVCAIAELFLHWGIDLAKCANWTNIHVDQLLHILCKMGYVIALTYFL